MSGGWIRVHRKTANHAWLGYNNPNRKEPLSEFEAWIDILFEVNHTQGRVMVGRKALICERGESLNSITTWSRRWKWNTSKTHRFLNALRDDMMIERHNEGVTTRITVCNYETYQSTRNGSVPPSETHLNGQTKAKQVTNKEAKKTIKEKKTKKRGFALSLINDSVLNELRDSEEFKGINIDLEFTKFKDNLEAKGLSYANYKSALKNWLRQPWVQKEQGDLTWLKKKAF